MVVVAGKHLYGRTLTLLAKEPPRLGVTCRVSRRQYDLPEDRGGAAGAPSFDCGDTLSNPVRRGADVPGGWPS